MSTQAAQLRIKELEGELLEKEVALQGLQAKLEAHQSWLTFIGPRLRAYRLGLVQTQGHMADNSDMRVSDWSALECGQLPYRLRLTQEAPSAEI